MNTLFVHSIVIAIVAVRLIDSQRQLTETCETFNFAYNTAIQYACHLSAALQCCMQHIVSLSLALKLRQGATKRSWWHRGEHEKGLPEGVSKFMCRKSAAKCVRLSKNVCHKNYKMKIISKPYTAQADGAQKGCTSERGEWSGVGGGGRVYCKTVLRSWKISAKMRLNCGFVAQNNIDFRCDSLTTFIMMRLWPYNFDCHCIQPRLWHRLLYVR